jgi:UDP-N-acetylmuramate: L-alanyl-gamma-D-glutamyl-meso-diaminopimelate ligase
MQFRRAHFIGIAGAGMSATAKLLRDAGVGISGSDQDVYPPVLDFLQHERIPFTTPYAAENIPPEADLIVIGKNARLVPETNAEVAAAYASGKTIASFPEVLRELSSGKDNIVVAGSYGKSTTAALLALCLETFADASYFIGAIPNTPAKNARMGSGALFVLEGDEYPSSNTDSRAKFLHYRPQHTLVTPLAHDHLNVYPTPESYLAPFWQLADLTARNGTMVVCVEGELSGRLLSRLSRPLITYGIRDGDFRAADIRWAEQTEFSLVRDGRKIAEIRTTQLGEHNVENIVGAAALVVGAGIMSPEDFSSAVPAFKGVKRRLDRKSDKTLIPIFEGFGSSYEKARSAIVAMKRHFPGRRLVVVFEPHTFSWRNRNALSWYDSVFAGADKIFVYEPASQGATTHDQITKNDIVERVRKAGFDVAPVPEGEQAADIVGQAMRANDAFLLLTSGNLGGLIERIPRIAEEKFPAPSPRLADGGTIPHRTSQLK